MGRTGWPCWRRGITPRHGNAHKYSRQDPRFLLKVVTEEWRVFSKSLSRAEQSFASELRETGNRLAHNDAVQRR